jgi:uncharacterized membrane protein
MFCVYVKKNIIRFWEIDLLRGIAVILMITFHVFFDLDYFNIFNINFRLIPIILLRYSIGITFLTLVGISLYLSYSKSLKVYSKKQIKLKFLLRGLKIFGLALIITFITWIYPHEGFIIFGVLHCIGLSIILSYPFLRFRILIFPIGILIIFLGIYLKTFSFDFNWLLWLGFTPFKFYTVDYFPLLPWFGVILIGMFIGNTLYKDYKRKFNLKDYSRLKSVRFFCYLGKHSLLIYFLHQPIIIILLYFLFL